MNIYSAYLKVVWAKFNYFFKFQIRRKKIFNKIQVFLKIFIFTLVMNFILLFRSKNIRKN
jgi:hypothetical protein